MHEVLYPHLCKTRHCKATGSLYCRDQSRRQNCARSSSSLMYSRCGRARCAIRVGHAMGGWGMNHALVAGTPCPAVAAGHKHAKKGEVARLPCNLVRIAWPKGSFEYVGGQYAFICVPAISLWQWHPFSLSSHPPLTRSPCTSACWATGPGSCTTSPASERSCSSTHHPQLHAAALLEQVLAVFLL